MSDSTHNILHDSITITMLEEDSRPWNPSPWTILTTTLVRRHYVLSFFFFFLLIKTFRFALTDIQYQSHKYGDIILFNNSHHHFTPTVLCNSRQRRARWYSYFSWVGVHALHFNVLRSHEILIRWASRRETNSDRCRNYVATKRTELQLRTDLHK
jgi:hypothetical protein